MERLRNGGVPRNPVFLMPATHCICPAQSAQVFNQVYVHTSEGGRDDRGVPYHAESTLSSAQVLKTSGLPPTGLTGTTRRGHPDVAGRRRAPGCSPPDLRQTAPPARRGRHHPRPGIYNAVLRSDLWALPALGTGHRLGIQNAPAGGPLQITDHRSPLEIETNAYMYTRP